MNKLPEATRNTMQIYGIRPVGKSPASRVYRSRELSQMDASQTATLDALALKVIYDLRKPSEVIARPTPPGLYAETITFSEDIQDSPERSSRQWEGSFVGKYGKPGERMLLNYQKMAHHSSFFSLIFHMIATKNASSLFHCINGKDRAGITSVQMLLIAGSSKDEAIDDYLSANAWNAFRNEQDISDRTHNLSLMEIEVVRSLFEAREEYLDAFFNEIDRLHRSFENYCEKILKITDDDREVFKRLLGLDVK